MHGLKVLDGGVQRKRRCVCARIYVCVRACVHAWIYTFMDVHSCIHVHCCMFIHVCVHVCTQVCVFARVHVPLCVHRCVYFRCGHLLPPCLRQVFLLLATMLPAPGFAGLSAPQNSPFSAPSPWGTRIMDPPGAVWLLGNSNSGTHPYFTH